MSYHTNLFYATIINLPVSNTTAVSCNNNSQQTLTTYKAIEVTYPATQKDTTVKYDYFGTTVADPYRWLENDTSAETAAWVKQQNEVTNGYLNQIPFRDAIKKSTKACINSY